MSTYGHGRRGLDVSRFLANGNAVRSPSSEGAGLEETAFEFDQELAKFTNNDWTEFDTGNLSDHIFHVSEGEDLNLSGPVQPEHPGKRQKIEGQDGSAGGDAFVNGGFPFPANNPFDLPASPSSMNSSPVTVVPYPAPPINAGPYPAYPSTPIQTSPTTPHLPHNKRPAPSSSTQPPLPSADESEGARLAAEEDKRRRNTAASARFRVKKKEREKALEKNAEELKKKTQELENQVEQLRNENKWLKELVVGRRDGLGGNGGIGAGVKAKGEYEQGERIEGAVKKGVGTKIGAEEVKG